jgi:hypothetical protein
MITTGTGTRTVFVSIDTGCPYNSLSNDTGTRTLF